MRGKETPSMSDERSFETEKRENETADMKAREKTAILPLIKGRKKNQKIGVNF